MKKLFAPVFFLLILFAFPTESKATHVMGADISWKCLGNDSFLITVNVYRDCNGINLGTGTIQLTPIGCGGTGFNVAGTISPGTDITHVCPSSCTRCTSPSCAFQYGYQKFEISAIVYLGNQSCCNWRISWEQCCRNHIITTLSYPANQNFYVNAELNKCVSPCNNSPEFSAVPIMLLNENQCFIYNQGAVDPDGDSLVYSLISPMQNSGTPVIYTTGYTYFTPLIFFGYPYHLLPFNYPQCSGFHLNPATGELKFKPIFQQTGVVAVKVEEYRNGVKIGETRRDLQFIVVNTPPNDIPFLSGIDNTTNTSITICPGSNSCFTITAHDADAADSIFINYFDGLPGASFSYVYDSINHITATICWTPQQQHVRSTPYNFYIEVKDNACPIPGFTSVPYSVYVKEAGPINYSATYTNCGQVTFTVLSPPAGNSLTWEIDSNLFTGNSLVYSFPDSGIYHFKLTAQANGCSLVFHDSVVVPSFQSFSMSLGNDTTVCKGSLLTITPQLPGSLNDYTFKWKNDNSTTAQKTLVVNSNTRLILTATHNTLLCTFTDSIDISVYPHVQLQFVSIPNKCENSGEFSLVPYATPTGGTWSGYGVVNDTLYPVLLSAGTHWFNYNFTDIYSCSIVDSISVFVQTKFTVIAGNDFKVCETVPTVNLSPAPTGGSWSGSGAFAVSNNKFQPNIAGPGNFVLIYTRTNNACTVSDTISVEVYPKPNIQFVPIPDKCMNAPEFDLTPYASPVGGIWSGNGVTDNKLNPALLSAGTHNLYYSLTNSHGCSLAASTSIVIQSKPYINAGNDIKICENISFRNLTPSPAGGTWSGSAAFAVLNNQFTPSVSGPGNFELIYTATINSCTVSDKILVQVYALPVISLNSDTIICKGDTISISASAPGAIIYSWLPVTALSSPSSATTLAFPSVTTNYSVTVTDNNYCQKNEQILITVENCIIGIDENTWERKITLFPNPANESIILKAEETDVIKVDITDALGSKISLAQTVDGSLLVFDIKNLSPGVYFMTIETGKGITVKKFMKD